MSDKKYCPLQDWDESKPTQDMKCKQEKCAWWNRSYSMCNVTIEGYIMGVKWSASE